MIVSISFRSRFTEARSDNPGSARGCFAKSPFLRDRDGGGFLGDVARWVVSTNFTPSVVRACEGHIKWGVARVGTQDLFPLIWLPLGKKRHTPNLP